MCGHHSITIEAVTDTGAAGFKQQAWKRFNDEIPRQLMREVENGEASQE